MASDPVGQKIFIGMGTCGLATGAAAVHNSVKEALKKVGRDIPIIKTGCIGMCSKEVLVDIVEPNLPRVTYGQVKPEMIEKIIEGHLVGGNPIADLAIGQIVEEGIDPFKEIPTYMDLPFFKKQKRIVLKRCGFIDPDSIDEKVFARHLYSPDIPDPDLLIRTSGEMRISNFLLWQLAYTEIVVTDVLWPDFREESIFAAIDEYFERERRFGDIKSRSEK